MTRRWPAGLVFGIAVAALPAVAQTPAQPDAVPPAAASSPPAEAPAAAPPVTATPKVLETPTAEPVADRKARFQFVRVGDNILRLDGDNGAVSLCNASGAEWTCQAVAQERVALDKEIERLRGEVAGLKNELTAGQARSQRAIERLNDELKAVKLAAAPPPPPPPPPAPERSKIELRLPTTQDYEHARAVVEEAWRRLVEGVAQVQSDMMRKL